MGARKVMTLLECGAIVTVVSPDVAEELLELAEKKMIELKKRPYKPSDIDGIFLVIGATDNEKLNWQINKDAERQNKLCNIADRPEACNFILPSIVNRGNLVIAISTSGKSPAFAKKMRQDLEKEFGEEYDEFLQLMGAIRKKALSEKHEPEAHKQLFEQLINRGLIDMIRDHDEERINSLLLEIFGEGYRFEELMKADS
ncbi:MAG: bifunctional precorrin-2 dehydrogenase/sirohydrochlorin ferrochelatase [Desulfobacteraceae bacterium]|nr:bifunctional precorrin-2 dehydrogenase/sirohydrochlorin ferrochelatase [Desulfobacteraceae bacterium]